MPRQKALDRLLIIIQKLPGIYHLAHQDYPKAFNRTLEWVSNNIDRFEPNIDYVQKSLFIWSDGYLKWRVRSLYVGDKNYAPLRVYPSRREDEQKNLTNTSPRKHPQYNCQCLAIDLLLQQLPQKISELVRELKVNNQTLYFYGKQKCLPLLREIRTKTTTNYYIDEKFRVANN